MAKEPIKIFGRPIESDWTQQPAIKELAALLRAMSARQRIVCFQCEGTGVWKEFDAEELAMECPLCHGLQSIDTIDTLLGALKEITEVAKEYIKEAGGCDHSVGICMCADIAHLECTMEVIAGVEKGLNIGTR